MVRRTLPDCPRGLVQPVRDGVQIVVEAVGAGVEGERRRGVAEHSLHGLHVRARGHGQAGHRASLSRGRSNDEIAGLLFLSPKTVRNHVSTVLGKLGVATRAEAVARARDKGFGTD